MPRYSRTIWNVRRGLFGFRVGLRYFKLHAPWDRPSFSEREGRLRALLKMRGWRLIVQPLPPIH